MRNVIVQIADPQWTTHALHLASALARNTNSHVILLNMMLAQNPGLLGTDIAVSLPTWEEYKQFHEYGAICEDYGVEFALQHMQYISLTGALREATQILNADALFAKAPDSPFSLWNKFQTWWLTRTMRNAHCRLYLVDETTRIIDWRPEPVESFYLEHPQENELAQFKH